MASFTFPRLIVIKYAGSSVWNNNGYASFDGPKSVFETEAKIEAERSTINDKYYNLRFCSSNKYWVKSSTDDNYVVATATEPQEDVSKPSCTLFAPVEVTSSDTLEFRLIHVQTGEYLLDKSYPPPTFRFYIGIPSDPLYIPQLSYVNWDTLVKMPQHIAFKGDNGKFLKAYYDDHYYLKFDSDDPNETASGHTVSLTYDGYVRINSDLSRMFWRRSPNWIWADSADPTENNNDTLFWPVKIDDETVALKNAGNNYFCKPLSVDGMEDCLNAAVLTMTLETRLTVQELVQGRNISGVTYRMDDARVYGVTPYVAGTTTATNDGDEEATISVEISYQIDSSYSFTNSLSITTGLTNTIDAGIPEIAEEKIEFSIQIDNTMEWGKSTTKTTSITATGGVVVPAKTTAVVKYVGSMGKCDVPFNYTQEDTSSVDGSISSIDLSDGVFTGVNCYNFDFSMK